MKNHRLLKSWNQTLTSSQSLLLSVISYLSARRLHKQQTDFPVAAASRKVRMTNLASPLPAVQIERTELLSKEAGLLDQRLCQDKGSGGRACEQAYR